MASIATLAGLAVLHAYWVAGGAFAKSMAIPERNGRPVLNPSARGTLLVAACLALAAVLILMRAGLLPAGSLGLVLYLATWALAIIFAVRAIGHFRYVGFFERVRGTCFARLDTAFHSPLCCLMALPIADATCI